MSYVILQFLHLNFEVFGLFSLYNFKGFIEINETKYFLYLSKSNLKTSSIAINWRFFVNNQFIIQPNLYWDKCPFLT